MTELCAKCKDNDAQDGSPLCPWCYMDGRFADFAKSCGLEFYPQSNGERYLHRLDGSCVGKKSENVEFMDSLWNALVRAKGGDQSLLIV